jgi:hypothetical protein
MKCLMKYSKILPVWDLKKLKVNRHMSELVNSYVRRKPIVLINQFIPKLMKKLKVYI